MSECNNTLELSYQDLVRPIGELFDAVMIRPGRVGLPRLIYSDRYDIFEMRITKALEGNVGWRYTVSCFLNGGVSYQLNGRAFCKNTPIFQPRLIAAGAAIGTIPAEFFSKGL